uniref:YTH domain-containing protein n=1 Tax=Cucumis melo TaxID=3656 RepID=A0A9I9E9B5_CUCME
MVSDQLPIEETILLKFLTKLVISRKPGSNDSQLSNLGNSGNQIGRIVSLNSRYFIVKSLNFENLELSVQQGVFATQRSNEAFDFGDNGMKCVLLAEKRSNDDKAELEIGCSLKDLIQVLNKGPHLLIAPRRILIYRLDLKPIVQ